MIKLRFHNLYFAITILLFLIEVVIATVFKTGFIRHSLGDYLVVIMLYALIRSCTDLSIKTTAILVLIIAFCIEFLQLTSFLNYFNLKNNTLAKLIFGSTFSISDLVAYTLGILTVILIEKLSL